VEEKPEESLQEGHPFGPVPFPQPGRNVGQGLGVLYRRPLLPKDRKSYHVGGNAFVPFDGFEPVTLCNLCLQKAMKSSLLWRGVPFACLFGVLSLELVKFFP